MSVLLESRVLRSFLHHLIDGLVDELERTAESIARRAASAPPARPETSRPRITLEPGAKKPAPVKPAAPSAHQYSDVTISCRSSCGRLEIPVNLSVAVVKRLRLKAHGKVLFDWHGEKLRVRPSAKLGRSLYSGGTTGRLFFSVWAEGFGVDKKQPSESCKFEYASGALLIVPPAWLKGATVPVSQPQMRSKKENSKPQDPPVSCKKMAGTNPTIKCHACKKATATVECSRCPTLLCDDCWQDHVRTHWHSKLTSKPPAGHVADLGK